MKIAIIGVLDDLAQKFLHSYEEQATTEHDFVLIDFVQPAPLIELGGVEFPVVHYTHDLLDNDIDLAICFGTPERKEIVLKLEDKGIRTIDLTGSFINEPTVPLVLFDHAHTASQLLLAAPSLHLHVFGPILRKLHQRFALRRVAITIFPPCDDEPRFLPDKMTEDEMSLINETIRLIDNNQVHYTASIRPLIKQTQTKYHLNIEFIKPFNMDSVRDVLNVVPTVVLKDSFSRETDIENSIIVNRVRRDFSADSAVHLYLSAEKPEQRVFENIRQLIEEFTQ